ncbi:MAG: hypothetical protein ACK5X3_07105 [Pseudomonadota bacterium]
MITTPIPLETRRAVGTLTAEAETVRRALGGGWTTPAAVEIAELALARLQAQMPALRLRIRQLRAEARAVRIEAEIMRRAG